MTTSETKNGEGEQREHLRKVVGKYTTIYVYIYIFDQYWFLVHFALLSSAFPIKSHVESERVEEFKRIFNVCFNILFILFCIQYIYIYLCYIFLISMTATNPSYIPILHYNTALSYSLHVLSPYHLLVSLLSPASPCPSSCIIEVNCSGMTRVNQIHLLSRLCLCSYPLSSVYCMCVALCFPFELSVILQFGFSTR